MVELFQETVNGPRDLTLLNYFIWGDIEPNVIKHLNKTGNICRVANHGHLSDISVFI